MDVFPKRLCGTAWFVHTSIEKPLKVESRLVTNDSLSLWFIPFTVIDDFAIAVKYLGDQNGLSLLAIVHCCAISINEFQQIDIGRTQCQRRCGFQLTFDTHLMGNIHHIVDTSILPQFDSNGIDRLGKGRLQRHIGTCAVAARVVGCPSDKALWILRIRHLQGDELVTITCGGSDGIVMFEC